MSLLREDAPGVFPATLARYKDLVRFVYKDDPLTEVHPWAMHAAVDANCLAAQSGEVYWTYVDYLHAHGQEVTGQDHDAAKSFAALDRIARQEATLAKLDMTSLTPALPNRTKLRCGHRRGWPMIWVLKEHPRSISAASGSAGLSHRSRCGW